uniref:Glycosyltransferase family 15 protein n=1 Tax=Mycena chlorophos TaxID=658473 RepID=A0ABQ0LXZ4_MYCCL|nr:glycosyltransferase family 15 protein [Mycena chlorophos]
MPLALPNFRRRRVLYVVLSSAVLTLFWLFYSRSDATPDEHTDSHRREWPVRVRPHAKPPPSPPTTTGLPSSQSPSLSVYDPPPINAEFSANSTGNLNRRANATLLMLTRNVDMWDALTSVRALEDRFNRRHHYPWVFLNDEEFSEEFMRRARALLPESAVSFGLIPKEHWNQPDWIDVARQNAAMKTMQSRNVKYGGNLAYHNMCRFNSGFFFRHPLLDEYKWYWRVEPRVKFHCDIFDDPFVYLEENDKVYGYTMSVHEIPATIPTLWKTVQDFMENYPQYMLPKEDNLMRFISNDNGRTYNRCHFWSNFEIASLDFWRSEAYTTFFEYLDKTGGFYYERWGDAPVHTLALALFLPRHKIHLFDEIGYQHDDWSHCPRDESVWRRGRCLCDARDGFDYTSDSCRRRWDALI